jgi:PAS domain S-box-containing protein
MGRSLDRSVQFGVVLVTTLLAINAVIAYRNVRQLDDDAKWVSHTHDTLAATDATMLALVDAETGERGYLLTGLDEYLQPYVVALPRLRDSLAKLDQATASNPSLHEDVVRLREMADRRLELLKERIDRRRRRAPDPGALEAGIKGKQQMDAIRGLVADIKATEQSLLAERQQRSRAAYATAVSTGLVTDALGLVAVGAFVWLVNRSAATRQQAAALVREQRQWLQVTLSSIGDAVIATDTAGRVVFLNPVASVLTGWTQEEAVHQPLEEVFQIFNEDTRQRVESPVHKVLSDGSVAGLANHTMLVAREGTERPIDDSAAPIRDDRGRVHGVVLIFRDVTERRRAADVQRRLAAIVESSDDAIVGKSLDGVITSWNAGAARLYGFTSDEIVGKPFSVLVPSDRPEEVAATVARLRRGERVEHFETIRRRKDGQLIEVAVSYSPIKDAEGKLVGTSVIGRDITERARAAAALRDSERRFAGFMHHLPGLAWIKDLQGRYVFANDAAEKTFRRTRAELYGKTDAEVFPEETARQFRDNDRRALESDAGVQVIETLEHADGVLHYSVVNKFPIPDQEGKPALVGGIAIDITDLKRVEAALKEADRRKDEFLAMLAHELRNPLAPISNALNVLKLPGTNVAIATRAREMMERQVEYMVRLVDDLLDVSRIMRGKIDLRRQPIELATVVARAVETAQPVIDAGGHQLTVSLPSEPLWLNGDLVRLAQVVGNLLNNASKYTERGGKITVTGQRVDDQSVLSVRDTGIGIAPDMLPRIFDMFVQAERRTQDARGGLGIGLTLVRRIVELHGGSVVARSSGPGKGSEFSIQLPLLPMPVSADGQSKSAEPRHATEAETRRILIVDDNADAADSLAIMLRLKGHEVEVARDGPAALARATARPPDVALLDIGMPVMDGNELARRFRQNPDLKHVRLGAVTGWGQDDDRRRTSEAGFDFHLVKPVDVASLEKELNARTATEEDGKPGADGES